MRCNGKALRGDGIEECCFGEVQHGKSRVTKCIGEAEYRQGTVPLCSVGTLRSGKEGGYCTQRSRVAFGVTRRCAASRVTLGI